jgi:hypothetical protein
MKSPLSTAVAIAVGLVALAAYLLSPRLDGLLSPLMSWAVILAAVATLIGIFNLLSVHWGKVTGQQAGAGYSLVALLGFGITVALGISDRLLQPEAPQLSNLVNHIQLPVESSLMAILTVSLAYASVRLFRRRGADTLSVTFVISTLVFLVVSIGLLTANDIPALKDAALAINRLPVAGARGILIGVALGSLLTGLRVLLGADRPYSG